METGAATALVVDDDARDRRFAATALRCGAIEVDEASDGLEALDLLDHRRYDVVVLDLALPSLSGIAVLREIRQRHPSSAVVMCTAADDSILKVVAFESGADDFCTKPVSERELLLRTELAIERHRMTETAADPVVITDDGLTIDPVSRIAVLDGDELELTFKEFDLLTTFASAPGRVFTRGELLEQVWAAKPDWQSVDTVTEHVYRLRQKLDAGGSTRSWIETVRGAGYRFSTGAGNVYVAPPIRSVS